MDFLSSIPNRVVTEFRTSKRPLKNLACKYRAPDDHAKLLTHDLSSEGGSTDAIVLDVGLSGTTLDTYCWRDDYGIDDENSTHTDSYFDGDYSVFSAPQLGALYRYHIYFSHSPVDYDWVQATADKLQEAPLEYKCCYSGASVKPGLNVLQNLLYAAMLSEIVIIVLTPSYVTGTWYHFQQTMSHLTKLSLHKQRMVIVLLEECEIPEPLQNLGFLNAQDTDFFKSLLLALHSGKLPRSSDSISSEMSAILSPRASLANGQLLATVTARIKGKCRASLVFDTEEVPTPLRCHGINLNYNDFIEILHSVSNMDTVHRQLTWVFTLKPVILLLVVSGIWVISLILVIVLLIDAPKASALPVRLTVFLFPLLLVVFGYTLRWKRRSKQTEFSMQMFSNCVQVNQQLYEAERPIVITSALTETDTFHIYFIYFHIEECMCEIQNFLQHLSEEQTSKVTSLNETKFLDVDLLHQQTLAERLTTMLAAAYCLQLLFKLIPKAAHVHHVINYQCLCQFVKNFVHEYLRTSGDCKDSGLSKEMFTRYINCAMRRCSTRTVQELLTTSAPAV